MSSVDLIRYPFSAVCGMKDAKLAILCALSSPRIRTVLVRGGQGSAKTVLCRSAGNLCGRKVVNVPLNVTEEQLFGGMDIEATIRTGSAVMQKGLLALADGGILYIDDANLLDRRILASLLECVISGRVVLEREGVSGTYDCDVKLFATMNPADSDLSPHMMDRFDLCAYSDFPEEGLERREILRRNAVYSDDPSGFVAEYAGDERSLSEKIARSTRHLHGVSISDHVLDLITGLSERMGADGSRGDIALANTSSAIAALDGRDEVSKKDVEDAARICLAHRRGYIPPPPEDAAEPPESDTDDVGNDPSEDRPQDEDDRGDEQDHPEPPRDARHELDDIVFEIGQQFRVIDYLEGKVRRASKGAGRKGRRELVESSDASGRYARSRITDEVPRDIAFDATIRAAAPFQIGRERNGMAVAIRKQDIREKVRERRSGCTILFLVDASGSLGVRKRMSAVKGAVYSMLRDSYVKRDRIGMMAFRKDSAELVLPPTRSVEYSYRKLEEMPTGGKTPLSQAIVRASEFMNSYVRSHPGERCHIVLITDGKANIPLHEGVDANEESRKLAEDISVPGVEWIVVDAGSGFMRFDYAEKLAQSLEATYFRLEELNADRLLESVRSVIG